MRRGLLTWLALLAVYAATLGVHSVRGHDLSPAEAHRLLVTDSIVHDGDLDVADDYAARRWERVGGSAPLVPAGKVVAGRRVEPAGIGTPLVFVPGYALGGRTGAELESAVLLALAFVLGAELAGMLVVAPWARRGVLAVALSPPALAASTTVAPEPAAALLITAAGLVALRARDRPRLRTALGSASLLAVVPWLSVRAVPAALVVAISSFRWLRRRNRAVWGFFAIDLIGTSAVAYVSLNDRLFGGVTPAAAARHGGPFGAGSARDVLVRSDRVGEVLFGAHVGLLRWAPVLLLAFGGAVLLVRSRRDRLSAIASDQVDVEVVASLGVLLGIVAIAVSTFARPVLDADGLVTPDLVVALPASGSLVAWGLRFAPRIGGLLVAITLGLSAEWLLNVRF